MPQIAPFQTELLKTSISSFTDTYTFTMCAFSGTPSALSWWQIIWENIWPFL